MVVDDHPLVCLAIKALISDLYCVDSVISKGNSKSTLEAIRNEKIDLIILDINLDDCNGFDLYRRIKAHGYKGMVLFLSAEQSDLFSETAFKIGAEGYVCKSEDHRILCDAVEGIANGYTFFKFRQRGSARDKTPTLSNRESVVMNYLVQGKTNKQIAEMLFISDKTVSTYKTRIMTKYNVDNLADLIKINSL